MKLHNILSICLFSIILVMGLASASIENLGTFKQGDCINIPQTCVSCSYVNISSIIYPDGTYALNEPTSMQKQDISYNFTFCNTTKFGLYSVTGSGDLDGTPQVWSFNFEITPTGNTQTISDSITLLIIIGVIIITAVFFTALAWFSNDQFLKTIFICIAGFTMTIAIFFGMTIMFSIMQKYNTFMTAYNSFFYIMTIIILVAVFTLIVYVMVSTFQRMYKTRRLDFDE